MAEKMLMQAAAGYATSRVLHTFVKLGIVDILAKRGEAMNATQIAAELGSDYEPQPLFRMLRYISTMGILDMNEGPAEDIAYHETYTFQLNKESELLREGSPLKTSILWRSSDQLYKLWGEFGESVKKGSSAVKLAFGTETMWDYLQQNQKTNEIFDQAMSTNSVRESGLVLNSFDFTGVSSVVDIGGGVGTLLFNILERFPDIKKGHLFDIPSVIAKVVVPDHLKERVEIHAGSFLDERPNIPEGADVYLTKHVIHDWADNEAKHILEAMKRAMAPHSKALVIEYVIPRGSSFSLAMMLDLHMMVVLGAKERTAQEYRCLLASAGLELVHIHGEQINVIEARLAPAHSS